MRLRDLPSSNGPGGSHLVAVEFLQPTDIRPPSRRFLQVASRIRPLSHIHRFTSGAYTEYLRTRYAARPG